LRNKKNGLCIFTVIFIFLTPVLSWSSEDKVLNETHDCDNAAGHPHDPGRWTEYPITDSDLAPAMGIRFCTRAVEEFPETPRFHFQLGRAHWVGKNYREALNSFKKAFSMGYHPAAKYIGDAYQFGFGLPNDEEPSQEIAKEWYSKAMETDFPPALEAYMKLRGYDEETVSKTTFNASIFQNSKLMGYIYAGNISKLEKVPATTLIYMETMLATLTDSTIFFIDSKCPPLVRRFMAKYQVGFSKFGTLITSLGNQAQMRDFIKSKLFDATIRDKAYKDTLTLAETHGCDSQTAQTIYKNISKFVSHMNKRFITEGTKAFQNVK